MVFTLYRCVTANGVRISRPTSNVIAYKDQRQLQIVNLESKYPLKSCVVDEDVTFWKWVNETTIGLVTNTSIYHWSIDSDASAPHKVFERSSSLQAAQIVSYKVNSENKWMALVGILQQGGRVVGNIQLYSRDTSVSQSIEGHAAVFAELQLDGASYKTKLFISAMGSVTGAKVQLHKLADLVSCISSRLSIIRIRIILLSRKKSISSSLLRDRTTSRSQCKFLLVTTLSSLSLNTDSFISTILKLAFALT